MQIAARKPTRTLWNDTDAEGRDTYEWRRNHEDGTPIEPASCAHYSKRQADLSWKEHNPPGQAGRPTLDRPAKEGINPEVRERVPPDLAAYCKEQQALTPGFLAHLLLQHRLSLRMASLGH